MTKTSSQIMITLCSTDYNKDMYISVNQDTEAINFGGD